MKYLFFPGCAYTTSAGYRESTEAVCRELGIELMEIPDWNCCGATMFLGEDEFSAAALAGRTFAIAEREGFKEIVTGCNACYTTLKKAGKLLFSNETYLDNLNRNLKEEGLEVTEEIRVRHLLDVIINDVPAHRWQQYRKESFSEIQIASYYGCQYSRPWDLTASGDRPEILEDFFGNLGFSMVNHSAKTMCCGAAAAVPQEKSCIPLVSRIVRGASAKGAHALITICPLCQFNVDSLQKKADVSPLPVLFFTQLAGLALGLDKGSLGLNKLINPADRMLRKF